MRLRGQSFLYFRESYLRRSIRLFRFRTNFPESRHRLSRSGIPKRQYIIP